MKKHKILLLCLGLIIIASGGITFYFHNIYHSDYKKAFVYLHTLQYPPDLTVKYVEGPQDCGFETCYFGGPEVLLFSDQPAKDFSEEVSAKLAVQHFQQESSSCTSNTSSICQDFDFKGIKKPPCEIIRMVSDEFNLKELHLRC